MFTHGERQGNRHMLWRPDSGKWQGVHGPRGPAVVVPGVCQAPGPGGTLLCRRPLRCVVVVSLVYTYGVFVPLGWAVIQYRKFLIIFAYYCLLQFALSFLLLLGRLAMRFVPEVKVYFYGDPWRNEIFSAHMLMCMLP